MNKAKPHFNLEKKNLWRKIYLLISILFFYFPARTDATEMCSNFVKLLNGESPICYFKIGFSNLFRANQKPIEGWVYYEGSIQNDTFWIRNCTNSPPQAALMLPGWLVGMSHSNFWSYSNDKVTTSPRVSKIPSPLDERAQQAMTMVKQAFGIGVPVLPGSIKIGINNYFEAKVNNGTDIDMIKGHFDVSSDGRPTRCEFRADRWADAKIVVSYHYFGTTASNCLPTSFKIETFNLFKLVDTVEYKILNCEFGELPLPTVGYTIDSLTNLGGINLSIRNIMGTVVLRDGAIYNMAKNGQLTLVNQDVAHEFKSSQNKRHFTLIILILLTTIPLLWLIVRTIIKPKLSDKTKG